MKLIPEGIVVVIPDHTLYPEARYEQMAREVAAAVSWTPESIENYGGNPRHIVLAGHSAGAHLTGLVLLAPRFLRAHGHSASEISGWVRMSGPYDIRALRDFVACELFRSSPCHFASWHYGSPAEILHSHIALL
jgi:acetyl esterase/lipase